MAYAHKGPSSDIEKIHKVARLVGVDRNVAINRAITACEELFERPTAWATVVAIADKGLCNGRAQLISDRERIV
jgi:hypothetical protein